MRTSLVYFILGLLLLSCNKEDAPDFIKSTGENVSDFRSVTNFDDILLNDNINLELIQDTCNWIKVTAGENLIPKITTEVSGSKLIISNNNRYNWVRSYKREITVSVGFKTLKHMTYNGSANVNMLNTLVSDTFKFETDNGTGSVKFNVNTKYCAFLVHSGPTDVTVLGKTDEAMFYTFGYAPIQANNLQAQQVSAHNRNIGKIYTSASKILNATIENSGNIYYTGNPETISLNKKGTGSLVKEY